jgi:EAL domain-containing protein (putative c-di-GMP-specific phosphodiesterase class I)
VDDADLVAPTGGDLDQVLDLARRHLGMDLVLLTEFHDDRQLCRRLAGDAAAFGRRLDDGPTLTESYCRQMTSGEAPSAVADATGVAALQHLGPVGSYVGVPVVLEGGALYGSLAAVSRATSPVDDKDTRFLLLVAERVALAVQAERKVAAERKRLLPLIENGRIDIALQPIVDLRSGRAVGVEALSRFPGGYGSPDVVFAAARAAGIGDDLELLAAMRAGMLLPLLDREQYLSINVTPGIAVELARRALETEGPLDQLALEFLEHAAMDNHRELASGLAAAREQGFKIAIDDAGTGQASLHHIAQLRPDIIKIHRHVVNGMSDDSARRSVVRGFVAFAADLGSSVVAAGVETQEDLEVARDLGVDAAQGYLLARPTTDRDDLVRMLGTRAWKSQVQRGRGRSMRRG